MQKIKQCLVHILSVSVFWGCASNATDEMMFEDVSVVTEAPVEISIAGMQKVDLTAVGGTDFAIKDEYLLLTTSDANGLIAIYSFPDMEFIGSFVKKGNGPNECHNQLFTNDFSFYHKDGELHINFVDDNSMLFDFNVDESAANQVTFLTRTGAKLPAQSCISYSFLGEADYMYKYISDDGAAQIRVLSESGVESSNEYMDTLNAASIPVKGDGFLFNILSTYTRVNPEKNLVLEVPLMMNHINIYGIRGNCFSRTIRIGQNVESIEKLWREGMAGMKLVFLDARVYDDYIGVVFKDKYAEGDSFPIIYFFDWQGVPLCSVRMDRNITAFDLDQDGHRLFVFDSATESLYCGNFNLENYCE